MGLTGHHGHVRHPLRQVTSGGKDSKWHGTSLAKSCTCSILGVWINSDQHHTSGPSEKLRFGDGNKAIMLSGS